MLLIRDYLGSLVRLESFRGGAGATCHQVPARSLLTMECETCSVVRPENAKLQTRLWAQHQEILKLQAENAALREQIAVLRATSASRPSSSPKPPLTVGPIPVELQTKKLAAEQAPQPSSAPVAETKKLAAEPARPSFSPRFHPYCSADRGSASRSSRPVSSRSQAFAGQQVSSTARKWPNGHDRRSLTSSAFE